MQVICSLTKTDIHPGWRSRNSCQFSQSIQCVRHEHRENPVFEKENIRKANLGKLFNFEKVDEAGAEVANLRLHAIASFPNLTIFSY
jgi:hypothetical protein